VITEAELGLLGLGARRRALVIGTAGVRVALQRGELALVVVAADVSARTVEKVLRLARGRRVRTVAGPSAGELGRRLGRPGSVQAVGVRDPHLAAGIGGGFLRQEERLGE
jgi:ribosomal protein L7Ae-like RNA K-turn-binding protein